MSGGASDACALHAVESSEKSLDDRLRPVAERRREDPNENTTQSQRRGVRTTTVWYAFGTIVLLGVVTLAALTWMWRTGRLSGIRDVTEFGEGQIAALAGSLPSGGARPLVAPRSVSSNGDLVFVTEPDAHRVSVFTVDGRFVRRIDAGGGAYPVDAVALGETLYVVDAARGRVLAVPVEGGGASRRVASRLKRPTAIAADRGALLIADADSGIWRMSSEKAEPVRMAGPSSTRGFTGGMVLDDDRLLVTDMGGSRVLDVAVGGGDIQAFGERVNLPRGIAVDESERVWVADVFGGAVQVFDASGTRLGDLEDGRTGGGDRAGTESPQGLAYDGSTNRMFVVDAARGRVLVYSVAR